MMKMNSKLNKNEDIENKIASNLAVIANESKIILTAIKDLEKKVSEGTITLVNAYDDFKGDLKDNIERIKNAEGLLPDSSPPRFQWTIAEIRDPITEALKKFEDSPSRDEISMKKWFNELADKFKSVHSISGKGYVLATFNEVVIKGRRPGWSIKLHEFLQRHLLLDPEDRKRVIEEINSRDDINALLDDGNDILYVIAGGVRRYLRGVGSLFLVFLLGFIIPWLINKQIIPITIPEGMSYTNLNIFYILCWVGFAIHIIMKSKDVRKENPCLDDILMWIHIKERGFITSAFAVIAGYIVLLGVGPLTWATAITSGFAVDSFGARIIRHYYSELEKAKKTLEEIKLESHSI
ncbi:MAG: hypothetical protein QMD22_02630 [archaeon]|nr:hypothetical protein [archaeon]